MDEVTLEARNALGVKPGDKLLVVVRGKTTIPMWIGLHQPSRLHTPEALQAATAIEAKVAGLITNDPIFKQAEGIEVFVFEEFV